MAKRVVLKSIEGAKGNFVKLNTGDFSSAVKKVTIEFNDGKKTILNGEETLFPRDPREHIDFQVSKGYISEEDGEKRKAGSRRVVSELAVEIGD
jgi:hypothetical protein